MVLFTPLVWLLVKLKNLVILIFGGKNDQPSMTEEELKLMIDEIEDEGVFDESESDLVKSAIEFSDISVSEILIPRVNIAAVEIDDDIESIKEKFISSHFSRLPVYEKTIDSIVGIIHEKYFFDMYLHGGKNISEIMQKPLYIFGLTAISDIMKEMQRSKSHMAIVVDQYGGTQGIVTMEDIIEELVGEIYDETDEEDTSFVDLGNGEYEVSGDLSIRDFLDKIGLPDDEIQTDCTSIGGLTMESLDHVPQSGEQVQVSRFLMKVISADEQKIDRVHISVMEKPEDSDSNERERDRDKDSDKEKDKDRDKDRDRDKDKDKDKSKDKDRDRDRSDKRIESGSGGYNRTLAGAAVAVPAFSFCGNMVASCREDNCPKYDARGYSPSLGAGRAVRGSILIQIGDASLCHPSAPPDTTWAHRLIPPPGRRQRLATPLLPTANNTHKAV